MQKSLVKQDFFAFAGVQGLEPRYSGPKPDVLPLDDTPKDSY